jgi:hypothetical protein
MAVIKKQHIVFKGETTEDSLLIGSHGDASVMIDGTFEISGIVYCPKYTVTLTILGTGTIAFRGICNRVIIKKMSGECTLDLRDLTCKELRCESIRKKSRILVGKTRIVTKVNLADEAIVQFTDRPLITNVIATGNSQLIQGSSDAVTSPR